jgi:hypothetical protein
MVNYYQRAIVRGAAHDTWLEESSAVMTEDLVGPRVSPTGFNYVRLIALHDYYFSGANLSLINWQTLGGQHYAMGGTFGAFLLRRYGVALYQAILGCGTYVATLGSSYQCLDALIKAQGGAGYADEFARFGATVFAEMGVQAVPAGFGYPAVTSLGLGLQAFPIESMFGPPPAGVWPSSTFPATSHAYVPNAIVGMSLNHYARTGVVVPPHSTLILVLE